MKKSIHFLVALLSLASLLLSSCVVAEKLTLEDGLSGKSHVDLAVDDFFVDILEDLSDWEQSGTNDAILDVAVRDFQRNLEASSVTSEIMFLETGHNTYMGYFSFSDFNQLLIDLSNGKADQNIVKTSEKNGRTHVEIVISMDNYEQLTEMIPFLANPNFEVYGPLYNHDLTEAEYLEMVSFILGEQCPESIGKSSVRIQVLAPSAVVEHNGKLLNSKIVEFSFPLIDFLLLHKPIQFYLEY